MGKKHKRFSTKERIELACLLKVGKNNKEIGTLIGKHKSTIGREIERNSDKDGVYRANVAKELAKSRRLKVNQKNRKIKGDIRDQILRKLRRFWSPEQISGWLGRKEVNVSYETIYQFIYTQRPDLKKYLRCRKGKYRRKRGTKERCRKRDNAKKKRIDQRPSVTEDRSRLGDWEGDTVRGKDNSGSILTIVERKTGLLIARKLKESKAREVRKETRKGFERISKKNIKTITFDNGSEFALHEMIERDLKTDVYFAYPYHSWERGTNENTNGLLRQFFPKGSSFKNITQRDIDKTVSLLNHRPRKRLNYKTPAEAFRVALRI